MVEAQRHADPNMKREMQVIKLSWCSYSFSLFAKEKGWSRQRLAQASAKIRQLPPLQAEDPWEARGTEDREVRDVGASLTQLVAHWFELELTPPAANSVMTPRGQPLPAVSQPRTSSEEQQMQIDQQVGRLVEMEGNASWRGPGQATGSFGFAPLAPLDGGMQAFYEGGRDNVRDCAGPLWGYSEAEDGFQNLPLADQLAFLDLGESRVAAAAPVQEVDWAEEGQTY